MFFRTSQWGGTSQWGKNSLKSTVFLLFLLNKNSEEHSTEFNNKKLHKRLIDYSYYGQVLLNSGIKNVHLLRKKY